MGDWSTDRLHHTPKWVRDLRFKLRSNDSKAWDVASSPEQSGSCQGNTECRWSHSGKTEKGPGYKECHECRAIWSFHVLVLNLPSPLPYLHLPSSWTTRLTGISSTWNVSWNWVPNAFSRVIGRKSVWITRWDLRYVNQKEMRSCFLGWPRPAQKQKWWDIPTKGTIWSCWSAGLTP